MSKIDFQAIAQDALSDALGFLQRLFPAGRVNGREYEVGDLQGSPGDSLKINITTGRWADFAAGESGGDLISLYAAAHGVRQIDAARAMSGVDNTEVEARQSQKPQHEPRPQQKPPAEFIRAEKAENPPNIENIRHSRFGAPSKVYTYRDAAGNPAFFICRFDLAPGPDGKKKKEFNSLSYGTLGEEKSPKWHWKSWREGRLLYRLENLCRPGAENTPVVIVEGEKACEAAENKFAHKYVCVTWPGGSNAINKVDWTPLAGRTVLLWPDADEPGHKAMHKIAETLVDSGITSAEKIYYLTPPEDVAKGWDAADFVEEKTITISELNKMIARWERKAPPAQNSGRDLVAPPPGATAESHEYHGGDNDTYVNGYDVPEHYYSAPVHIDTGEEVASPVRKRSGRKKKGDNITTPGEGGETYDMDDEYGIRREEIFYPHLNNGKPSSTPENMKAMLDHLGIGCRYNIISKSLDISIPDFLVVSDNREAASLIEIRGHCVKQRMTTDGYDQNVFLLASKNPYNPVEEFIKSKPWDGVSRLKEFYNTVRSTDEQLKERLMFRWLLSAVAAACEPNGVSAQGVLTFTGQQNVGKTAWFKKLVPENLKEYIKDGMMLDPSDRDSVYRCISQWLVELGELDATFRKADIAALKAFITQEMDYIRLPYARAPQRFGRRTVFFASVNEESFLYDKTGNKRFWAIETLSINFNHDIDMQQLWAEVYLSYLDGEKWYLNQEEFNALTVSNTTYEVNSDIEDMLLTFYDWEKPFNREMTATEVCKEMGLNLTTKGQIVEIGKVIRKLTGRKSRKSNGKRLIVLPVPRNSDNNGTNSTYQDSEMDFYHKNEMLF